MYSARCRAVRRRSNSVHYAQLHVDPLRLLMVSVSQAGSSSSSSKAIPSHDLIRSIRVPSSICISRTSGPQVVTRLVRHNQPTARRRIHSNVRSFVRSRPPLASTESRH